MDDNDFQHLDVWPPGTVVGAKYRIVRELGAGGFAVTYLAECVNGSAPRVLKRLHEQFARQKDFARRLEREASSIAKLRECPYVVDVHGLETLDRRLVLVMGYVNGEPLGSRLLAGAIATPEAVGIASQLAAGLKAIHERGLLHRDLKPANILVPKDARGLPRATIIDFGLAIDPVGTRTTFGAASAGFAPPEQYVLTQENQDPRLDLFSFGATFYFMLAGHKAYASDVLISSQPLPPPPLKDDGDWPGLNDLVMGLIQPDRDLRMPGSASAVLAALDKVVEARRQPFAQKLKRAMAQARNSCRSREYGEASRLIEETFLAAPLMPFTAETPIWETAARDLSKAAVAADSDLVGEIEELAHGHQGRPIGPLLVEIAEQVRRDQHVRDFRGNLKYAKWEQAVALLGNLRADPNHGELYEEFTREVDSFLLPKLETAANLIADRDYAAAIMALDAVPADTSTTKAAAAMRSAAECARKQLYARGVWALEGNSSLDAVRVAAAALIDQSERVPHVKPEIPTAQASQERTMFGGLKYFWIPPGEFQMGAPDGDPEALNKEKPSHPVRITKGFWMSSTTVTVGAYKRFAVATKRKMPREPKFNPDWLEDLQPMVNVSWNDAMAYCNWAGLRLPTEAQWEYAARAGTEAARYGELDEIAWHAGNSDGQAHSVGLKAPNSFGLHDMLGNVCEWTADWWADKYEGDAEQIDPQGPSAGIGRVVRGGSWDQGRAHSRVTFRHSHNPESKYVIVGFRCVSPKDIALA